MEEGLFKGLMHFTPTFTVELSTIVKKWKDLTPLTDEGIRKM